MNSLNKKPGKMGTIQLLIMIDFFKFNLTKFAFLYKTLLVVLGLLKIMNVLWVYVCYINNGEVSDNKLCNNTFPTAY